MPNIRRFRYICLPRPAAWRFRRCARLLTSPYRDCVLGLLASRMTHEQFSADCPETRLRSTAASHAADAPVAAVRPSKRVALCELRNTTSSDVICLAASNYLNRSRSDNVECISGLASTEHNVAGALIESLNTRQEVLD